MMLLTASRLSTALRIVHVQVHLVAALADLFALAEVVHVGDTLARLTYEQKQMLLQLSTK
jgi:hypothetical protein